MAEAAHDAGLEYIAITDHSQALAMANGLDERRALAHAARIRARDGHANVRLLAGIECDIRPDGTLEYLAFKEGSLFRVTEAVRGLHQAVVGGNR